jgi:hypothetical protein
MLKLEKIDVKHLKKVSDNEFNVTPIYMSFSIIQKEIRKV